MYGWRRRRLPPALRAGQTYLAIAVLGGMVMLMGLFLLYHMFGTLEISELRAHAADADARLLYTAGGCLLVGFGAKAGAFPLHIWLPKHIRSLRSASALLSGILTKAGIYGVLILSAQLFFGDPVWGALLLGIGVLTMFGRGAARRVLDRPEADAGLLLNVSDRIYPDRHWHAGPACGRT